MQKLFDVLQVLRLIVRLHDVVRNYLFVSFKLCFAFLFQVLQYSIRKSDMDLRRVLYSNIVLSGGSTLFKGMRACKTILDINFSTRRCLVSVILKGL